MLIAITIALGLLFLLNTTAVTLLAAVRCSNPNPQYLIRIVLTVISVNILVDALVFIALF